MPFTGTPIVQQISDSIVRITGVAVPANSAGAIALAGYVPPDPVSPPLGAAERFAILTVDYVNDSTETSLVGDLGYIVPPVADPVVVGTTHPDDATYHQAQADAADALVALEALAPTFTFAPGAVILQQDTTHGPQGVYTAGVYVITGNAQITGALTLTGPGLFVFRISGSLHTGGGSSVIVRCTLGADPANVWWLVGDDVDVGNSNTMAGTAIASAPATVAIGAGAVWFGRVLGFTSTTTDAAARITVPSEIGEPVILPVRFAPTPYIHLGELVDLAQSLDCAIAPVSASQQNPPLVVTKTGSTAADFLATFTNQSLLADSPNQEIYVKFHE